MRISLEMILKLVVLLATVTSQATSPNNADGSVISAKECHLAVQIMMEFTKPSSKDDDAKKSSASESRNSIEEGNDGQSEPRGTALSIARNSAYETCDRIRQCADERCAFREIVDSMSDVMHGESGIKMSCLRCQMRLMSFELQLGFGSIRHQMGNIHKQFANMWRDDCHKHEDGTSDCDYEPHVDKAVEFVQRGLKEAKLCELLKYCGTNNDGLLHFEL